MNDCTVKWDNLDSQGDLDQTLALNLSTLPIFGSQGPLKNSRFSFYKRLNLIQHR